MLKDHIHEFLDFLRLNRNLSPHTLRAYDTDLSQFLSHLATRDGVKPSEVAIGRFDPDGVRGFLAELHDLSSRVPEGERARHEALERELGETLRQSVRTVRDAVQAEVQREIAAGDLAAAWRTYDEELAARLAETSGYRLEELAAAGVNLAPWQTRITLELEGATETAVAELETALGEFEPRRLAEVERELERQEWDRALHLLEIPGATGLLEAAGFTRIRLPETLVAGLVDDVQDEFRQRAERLRADWKLVDDELRTFVDKRRATLEETLHRGPPRIRAADMLREAFEQELFERRLTREKMPQGLSRTALGLLDESTSQLLELEARLHEEDARADFDEVEELSRSLLSARAYEEVRALWGEARARLGELERFAGSAWLAAKMTAAVGFPVIVRPALVLLTGTLIPNVTVKAQPDGVVVLDRMDIPRAFKKAPQRLDHVAVTAVYEAARRPSTWHAQSSA